MASHDGLLTDYSKRRSLKTRLEKLVLKEQYKMDRVRITKIRERIQDLTTEMEGLLRQFMTLKDVFVNCSGAAGEAHKLSQDFKQKVKIHYAGGAVDEELIKLRNLVDECGVRIEGLERK